MRPRVAARLVCVIAMTLVASCLQSSTVQCGDRICPASMACAPDVERCVFPEQLTACEDKLDLDPCSFGGTDGVCRLGVCNAAGCGDDVISGAEECEITDLAGMTCLDFDFYTPEGLGCGSDCTFD